MRLISKTDLLSTWVATIKHLTTSEIRIYTGEPYKHFALAQNKCLGRHRIKFIVNADQTQLQLQVPICIKILRSNNVTWGCIIPVNGARLPRVEFTIGDNLKYDMVVSNTRLIKDDLFHIASLQLQKTTYATLLRQPE